MTAKPDSAEFYLQRLERFLLLKSIHNAPMNANGHRGFRLLIRGTAKMCQQLGAGQRAETILNDPRWEEIMTT